MIDYKSVMKALRDIDYDGEFTLEAYKFPKRFEPDFQQEALNFMAKRARYLANMTFED